MVELDDAAYPQPAVDAALAVGLLACAEARNIEGLEPPLEGLAHRDVLEHLAGRHPVRQVGRVEHVDPAHRDRIELQLAGDRLDGAVHHPAHHPHGGAHRSVAAFVGEHDLDVVGVVGNAIGAGEDQRHDPRHVVGRVEAIAAEVLGDRELEREDAAVAIHRRASVRGILARMARREQVLGAILAPTHGFAQRARQRRTGQLLAVERDLLPKSAADVRGDDCDLGLAEAQPPGELRAIGMRHLVADMHRQVLAALIPHRAAPARLDRRVGLAVLMEFGFDHERRLGEAAFRVAGREGLMRDQVRRQRLVDQRGAGRERTVHAGDRRKRLVRDLDQLGGILGQIAVARRDAHHRVANEAHLVDRQRGHLDRMQPLDRRRHAQRRGPLHELAAGHDAHHARRLAGSRNIDRPDAGVCVRRAHEVRMQRASDDDVVEIAALPGEKTVILLA